MIIKLFISIFLATMTLRTTTTFLRTIIRNFDKGDSLSLYLLSIAVPFLIQYPY